MIPLRALLSRQSVPVMTLLIIGLNVFFFLDEMARPMYARDAFIEHYALIPDQLRLSTFITSMFLHGGWLHLIGNMWFLWVFGSHIEDAMGSAKFAIFYLISGVASAAVQFATNLGSPIPTIGASGAIAGVMGAFLILYPRVRVVTLIFIIVFVTTVDIPAAFMLLYWFAIQLLSGITTISSVSNAQGIAWFAHVGGFLAGILLVRVFLDQSPPLLLLMREYSDPNEPFENLRPLDVLAIAAHPDDVEQTCGGTLIATGELGYRTGVLDLTAGDMGSRGTPDIRIQESQTAAQQMLLSWRQNLRWPDARLENTITARMTLAGVIRRLRPRVVILPYWNGRHPDHYRASEIGYEACFLAGLRRLEEDTPPHRPFKILYSSLYANVTPSFVVDISRQFDRRMAALLSYASQYGNADTASDLFPSHAEVKERLAAVARFYGNLIGVKYGEPFVVKESIQVDDIVNMPVRSI